MPRIFWVNGTPEATGTVGEDFFCTFLPALGWLGFLFFLLKLRAVKSGGELADGLL